MPLMLFLLVLIIFQVFFQGISEASDFVDRATGIDQTFNLGNSERHYAEGFHRKETYGILPDKRPENQWLFSKSIGAAVTYDDNLFQTRTDPKDDLIYAYSVPLSLSRKTENTNLAFAYSALYANYTENHKQNTLSHRTSQGWTYKKNRLDFSISNSFTPGTKVATGDRSELNVNEDGLVTTIQDSLGTNIKYKVSPKTSVGFSLGYSYFFLPIKKNSDNATISSSSTKTISMAPTLYYAWTPKTTLHATYGFSTVDYFKRTNTSDNFSSQSTEFTVGGNGRLTSKMTFDLDTGFSTTTYRNKDITPSRGFVLKGAIHRKLTPKIPITASYVRSIGQSFDTIEHSAVTSVNTTYGLDATYQLASRLTLDAAAQYTYSTTKDIFVSGPDVENDFLTFTRQPESEQITWDLGLNWTPKYLLPLRLGYSNIKQHNTFKSGEYNQQKLVLSSQYSF